MRSIFNIGAADDDDDEADTGADNGYESLAMPSLALEGILEYARALGGDDDNTPYWCNTGEFAPNGFGEAPPPTLAEILTTQKPMQAMSPLRFNAKPTAPFRLTLRSK